MPIKPFIVAVHGGAGYHSTSSEKAVKHALRRACQAGVQAVMPAGHPAVDITERADSGSSAFGSSSNPVIMSSTCSGVVENAIRVLEDHPSLNAGFGSNLTLNGQVECDASIMDGLKSSFGSVGSVQGVKNPISLARAVMENTIGEKPLGRVPPMLLVGKGAHDFAASSNIEIVDPSALISESAIADWRRWKSLYENASEISDLKLHEPSNINIGADGLLENDVSVLGDTVGAVACDSNGILSAGVSSGGLLLKYPGRLGEAAIFGAGIWAHSPEGEPFGIACSFSGTGEQIMRASLARTLSTNILSNSHEDTHEVIERTFNEFSRTCSAQSDDPLCAGALIITKEKEDDGRTTYRLWCAFTTQSMAIAYASHLDSKPRARIIRRPTASATHGENGKMRVYITCLPLTKD